MRYILDLLPIIPIAGIITGIIYFIVYKILSKKRERISKGRMFLEYLLIGWILMFLYVTQIMNFGNGIGSLFNLKPLHQFYIAFRYGLNNAQGVWQFLLNIIMFVPLGILVPMLFKEKRNWKSITIISFLFTLGTELLQLISRRGSDIDDLIANTLGGLCGFALFLIVYGIIKYKKNDIEKYFRKLIIGLVLLITVSCSFITIKMFDGSSKYGNLYYGHLVPSSVDIKVELSNLETTRKVYKYVEKINIDDLKIYLEKISGLEGSWTKEDDTFTLKDGDKRIFIFDYNRWDINYEYGMDEKVILEENKVDEQTAVDNAKAELKKYNIENVKFSKNISDEFSENNYYFIFEQVNENDNINISGNILITVGKDGRIIEVYDTRIECEYIEETTCISQADSVEIAKDVGTGSWPDKAVVTEVVESYSFISDTGYLVPTWKIKGYIIDSTGKHLEWIPEVDAVK